MIKVNNQKLQFKIEEVYQHNQQHVFQFWNQLSEQQQGNLLIQLDKIDFSLLEKLIAMALDESTFVHTDVNLDLANLVSLKERKSHDKKVRTVGEDALRDGKVAAFLVAGGQGTRLGYDGPKGMYPVTPVKKKSLFQLHAEKLVATGSKYNTEIPWYIMTSETNHRQTVSFFEENSYFGYDKKNISFFMQEMIPAIDKQGKLILDAADHIFMNPNGHGGSLSALWKSGAIADLKEQRIEYIFYFQVDNVLTRVCDPVYLGYHIEAESEMSNKVVRKLYPEEKMGIICKINGKTGVVEYSDLSEEDMYARDSDGELKFWAGSIATHILNVSFVEQENKEGFKLPYHLARKNIPYVDSSGSLITPDDKNGIKFETFVFDALLDTKRSISIEVERNKEFSPLKNSEGENSPHTVKQDLNNVYGSWLEQCGIEVPRQNDNVQVDIEISPLYALNEQDLNGKSPDLKKVYSGFYLE